MRSSGTTWPRQLRRPGQAAAPEGPIDMQVMYLMHHAFRRDLDRFAAAVRSTPVGDRRTWQLLAERWELFAEVLHKHHTTADDLVWPVVMRLGSTEDVIVLEAMEAEHGEIDPLLASCAAGFRRLAQRADEDARAALAVRVTAARESLRRHLAHEESSAIAIIQRLVDPEQWEAIDREIGKEYPFAFALRIVPWIAHDVPRETLQRIFAQLDPPFRVVHRLTRRRFARQEARTFRYA